MSFASARKEAGLSQSDAATRLGVTTSAISQWENGATLPAPSRLPEIADLYGCTIEHLLTERKE